MLLVVVGLVEIRFCWRGERTEKARESAWLCAERKHLAGCSGGVWNQTIFSG